MGLREHWQQVHTTKDPARTSWYEGESRSSARVVEALLAGGAEERLDPKAPVIDVGAGSSAFVDDLLRLGFADVTLLDIAEGALDRVRKRLGRDPRVRCIATDVTNYEPDRCYALWHDRAAFHFLNDNAAQAAYRRVLAGAVRPGGYALVATFADDGPTTCSGLPVQRYGDTQLVEALTKDHLSHWTVRQTERMVHSTPFGTHQSFVRVLLRRTGDGG
jgi:SAM-dependent methyltransferase